MQLSTAKPPLNWRCATLEEAARYAAAIRITPTQSADYTFGNIYMWNETYQQSFCFVDDYILIRIAEDGVKFRYLFPIGKSDPSHAVAWLLEEAKRIGQPLCFVGVTEDQLATLDPELAKSFTVTETRDHADYIYSAEALATLKGKKLHAKRNHINTLTAAHTWGIRPLSPVDFPACREILAAWESATESSNAPEHRAILRAFDAFNELSLFGALLTIDEMPVAFTIGEMIGEDTLCVHFEKALPTWRTAYPLINREFVKMTRERYPSLAFVNREDDMGLAGLRTAKLSYHPAFLLRKFALRSKNL